ncbi:MAG: imidazole glycerol phosphate synthase subunit HisF [Bdellovibrionales bacterium]|jgi:cyclase|nr:imidazole glycerol phosphate synthase subunit HisF [Bdellovibrionales bacterium]
MLARRIIPCLDVAEGKVVKGVRFRDHEVVGEIEDLASFYSDEGADELVFYDITASADGRDVSPEWVERIARRINIPFCVAGGISSVEAAKRVLFSGADKVSVNTPALLRPQLIAELAEQFGRQCVVVGIDSIKVQDEYLVRSHTGRTSTQQSTNWKTLDWIAEVQRLGAGEIVLNCMDQDGVRTGYDLEQLLVARALCDVPLVASGGAGALAHFEEVFRLTQVDGALAASVFHKKLFSIGEVKRHCRECGIRIRQ